MTTMTIVVQYAIWEYPYTDTTNYLNQKGVENLYVIRSPLPEVDEGALAEKGSTKMTKWSS